MSELALVAAAAFALVLLAMPRSLLVRLDPRTVAWRHRAISASLVAAAVIGLRATLPDPSERGRAAYLLVLTLGYGHLLGAAWFGGGRRHSVGLLDTAIRMTGLLSIFALYARVLPAAPELVYPLLAIATWHTCENDVALERSYRLCLRADGPGRRPAGLPRELDSHLVALGFTLLVLAVGQATLTPGELGGPRLAELFHPSDNRTARALAAICGVLLCARRRRGPSGLLLATAAAFTPSDLTHPPRELPFADYFAATTLYHLVSWLVFTADRARRQRGSDSRARARALCAIHAAPAAITLVLLALGDRGVTARGLVFSPGIYLFWSVAHAFATARQRMPGHSSGVKTHRPAAKSLGSRRKTSSPASPAPAKSPSR